MKTANSAKRFGIRFHCVAANCAMNVKIDKTGCEIISAQIHNVFSTRLGLLTNCSDFSLASNHFKSIANSIGKNQARVSKNHFPNAQS